MIDSAKLANALSFMSIPEWLLNKTELDLRKPHTITIIFRFNLTGRIQHHRHFARTNNQNKKNPFSRNTVHWIHIDKLMSTKPLEKGDTILHQTTLKVLSILFSLNILPNFRINL